MNRSKIKSIKHLGTQQVYNLEMRSDHHNYITEPNVGGAIHKNSHSCAYIMIAYWCLWLKSHYPAEWWATVMNSCKHEKLIKYINVARTEGVEFGPIDIENLTADFSVNPESNVIIFGLASLKKVKKAAKAMEGKRKYTDIDNFIEVHGKNKTVMERLILLGAFKKYHPNIKATWMWYQYKYCTGKQITKLRKAIQAKLLEKWTDEDIAKERDRQRQEFKKMYPNRKVPKKITTWKPKPDDNRDSVMALFDGNDYSMKDVLEFEKEYLGYYWHNPMSVFLSSGLTVDKAMNAPHGTSAMEVVIDDIEEKLTKNGNKMARVSVTDGVYNGTIVIWEDQLAAYRGLLKVGNGVKMFVKYDPNWKSFSLDSDHETLIMQLERNDAE